MSVVSALPMSALERYHCIDLVIVKRMKFESSLNCSYLLSVLLKVEVGFLLTTFSVCLHFIDTVYFESKQSWKSTPSKDVKCNWFVCVTWSPERLKMVPQLL